METQQRQLTKVKVMMLGGMMLGCLASSIVAFGASSRSTEGAVIKAPVITRSTEEDDQVASKDNSSEQSEKAVTELSSSNVVEDCSSQVTESSLVVDNFSEIETESKIKVETEEMETEVDEEEENYVEPEEETTYIPENTWYGDVLDPSKGTVQGPSGTEVYYNLNMSYCVQMMYDLGYSGDYWVRWDGVQMFGDYIMVAANLEVRPKGTVLETSLGTAIVADKCEAAYWGDPYLIDISVTW